MKQNIHHSFGLRMLKAAALTLAFASAPAVSQAATLAALATLPSLFDFAVLGIAVAAAFGGLRVRALVKGGALAKCWQFIFFGFVCLSVAQFVHLLTVADLVVFPDAIRPLLLCGAVGMWLVGINDARKALG